MGAATTIVMDAAGGLVSGEAGLKNIVKTQADIKSSTSKELLKSKPQLIKLSTDQIRTGQRIGSRVVKVGTRASATQQNAQCSSKKSNYTDKSQPESATKTSSTGKNGNENQS